MYKVYFTSKRVKVLLNILLACKMENIFFNTTNSSLKRRYTYSSLLVTLPGLSMCKSFILKVFFMFSSHYKIMLYLCVIISAFSLQCFSSMMRKGYRQDQRFCVSTVHHQSRVNAQSHDGHEVTWSKEHRWHLENESWTGTLYACALKRISRHFN